MSNGFVYDVHQILLSTRMGWGSWFSVILMTCPTGGFLYSTIVHRQNEVLIHGVIWCTFVLYELIRGGFLHLVCGGLVPGPTKFRNGSVTVVVSTCLQVPASSFYIMNWCGTVISYPSHSIADHFCYTSRGVSTATAQGARTGPGRGWMGLALFLSVDGPAESCTSWWVVNNTKHPILYIICIYIFIDIHIRFQLVSTILLVVQDFDHPQKSLVEIFRIFHWDLNGLFECRVIGYRASRIGDTGSSLLFPTSSKRSCLPMIDTTPVYDSWEGLAIVTLLHNSKRTAPLSRSTCMGQNHWPSKLVVQCTTNSVGPLVPQFAPQVSENPGWVYPLRWTSPTAITRNQQLDWMRNFTAEKVPRVKNFTPQ